jgi:hypothetical protein
MKRTNRKNKVGQQKYEVRKLGDPECRKKFRIELWNGFTALEGMEDGKSVDTVWYGFKSVFKESAKSYIRKEKERVNVRRHSKSFNIEERKSIQE